MPRKKDNSTSKNAKSRALPPRREKFARNLVDNGGKKQKAAEDAGFAPGPSAAVEANRLLKNAKVLERIRELSSHADVRTPEIVGTLASHMRADVADFFEEGDNAIIDRAKKLGISHLIRELDITERFIPQASDKPPIREVRTKFKLHDPQAAARTLGKYRGLEQAARENDADVRRKSEQFRALVDSIYDKALTAGEVVTRAEIQGRVLARRPDLAPYAGEWLM